jgi:uncharacterized protein YjbI with pentapeptide repeats
MQIYKDCIFSDIYFNHIKNLSDKSFYKSRIPLMLKNATSIKFDTCFIYDQDGIIQPRIVDLSYQKLNNTKINNLFLVECNFKYSKLFNVVFERCIIDLKQFKDAEKMVNVSFKECVFKI